MQRIRGSYVGIRHNHWTSTIFTKIEGDQRTTLMIKNIPNKYTSKLIRDKINKKFEDRYNFFYLPMDRSVIVLKLALVQHGILFH